MTDEGRNEDDELLATLFQVIRHDVRNRLASARMAAHWLRKRSTPTPLWDAEPRMGRLHAMIDEELVAIDELLSAHLPSARALADVVDVALLAIVARATRDLDDAVRLEGDGARAVRVEREAASLALRLLVRNALEARATPHGARLTTTREADRVLVCVWDDGPGFTDEARVKAFAGLYTTKPGARGLGIATAARLARSMGGDVVIRPGLPTCVALSLPAVEPAGQSAA